MDRDVREAAYRILAGKGATYCGIGAALARLVQVILADQRAILMVCTPSPESEGWPRVTLSAASSGRRTRGPGDPAPTVERR